MRRFGLFVLLFLWPAGNLFSAAAPEIALLKKIFLIHDSLTNYSVSFEARSGGLTNRTETRFVHSPYLLVSRESLKPNLVRIFTPDSYFERFDDQKLLLRCLMNGLTPERFQEGAILALQASQFQGWVYPSSFAYHDVDKIEKEKDRTLFLVSKAGNKSLAVIESDSNVSRLKRIFVLSKNVDLKTLNHESAGVLTSSEFPRFQEVKGVGAVPLSIQTWEKGRLVYESEILKVSLNENKALTLYQNEVAQFEKKYTSKDK
ncbi:MAG: hypothetical protein JNM63_01480 [Spirochaetia bacterium]|nr:hypothetical protein [Spirochaetia bacterium]